MESLTFGERIWIKVRSYHKLNKILSIIISLALATWTLSYKHMAYGYYKATVHAGVYPRHANIYNFVCWLTYIYYTC